MDPFSYQRSTNLLTLVCISIFLLSLLFTTLKAYNTIAVFLDIPKVFSNQVSTVLEDFYDECQTTLCIKEKKGKI
jgi:hypothetical protein